MKSRPMITAHSGCEGLPDNSIAALERGVALGADCVEVDVRVDAAGGLWLTHDCPEDFSGLPSLADAFAIVRAHGVAVNCDLKDAAALRPVLALAKRCGIEREQLIFTGEVDPALLREDSAIAANARVFLNVEALMRDMAPALGDDRAAQYALLGDAPARVAERLRALGAEALNCDHNRMPAARIDALRKVGVALSLWTIDGAEALRRAMALDALNITTHTVAGAVAARAALFHATGEK